MYNRLSLQALAICACLLALAVAGQAVTTGVVCGRVTDVATGKPLAAANIELVGTPLGAVTDSEGYYAIANVPPDTYQVKASLVGYYEGVVAGVVVNQDQSTVTDLALEGKVEEVKGAEARVVASRITPRTQVTSSAYSINHRDEQALRGQPNDLYQFPGIVFGQPGVVPDANGYPHIRGARTDQVGYMLEGIPIVEPNNNIFATNIVTVGLDRLELFTGGYTAPYGGYVGGVINEVVKRGDQVRGGFVDVGGGTPWGYNNTILEAGNVLGPVNWYFQTNRWESRFPGNEFTASCPDSADAIAKVIYQADDNDQVTLLANHGYARYEMPFEHTVTHDPATGDWLPTPLTQDYGRQGYSLDAVSLSHTLSPGSFWSARAFDLQNWLHLDLGSDVQSFWMERHQVSQGLQFDYTNQLNDRHLLKAGLWQIWGNNYQLQAPNVSGILPFAYDILSENDTASSQAYLFDHWRATDKLLVDAGLRLDYMRYNRREFPTLTMAAVSPRLGATYLLNNNFLLRGTWGQYAQMPPAARVGMVFPFSPDPTDFLGVQNGRSDLKPEKDEAVELGFESKLSSTDLASVTWFSRNSRRMVQKWLGLDSETWDSMNGEVRFASTGHGHSHGLELKLQRRSTPLSGWLSYTYAKARATASLPNAYPYGSDMSYGGLLTGPGGLTLDSECYVDWDQRHTASLVLDYQVGRWQLSPTITWGSGYAYGQSGVDIGGDDIQHGINPTFTADGVTYDEGTFTNVPILVNGQLQANAPNSLRTGSHLTVNLTVNYRLRPETSLYLSVFNLLAAKDVTHMVWYDPNTYAVLGYTPPEGTPSADNPGVINYRPYTRTPPRFIAVGLRQSF